MLCIYRHVFPSLYTSSILHLYGDDVSSSPRFLNCLHEINFHFDTFPVIYATSNTEILHTMISFCWPLYLSLQEYMYRSLVFGSYLVTLHTTNYDNPHTPHHSKNHGLLTLCKLFKEQLFLANLEFIDP